ncbi:hypothetical protein LCGC14_0779110 [marine sediment metagenome]|uniref:Uncharacterized protein n=1 Tax=marine sediment metagenome TaxID=412755 RepID=A0A0F9QFZ9_9ZZZZ
MAETDKEIPTPPPLSKPSRGTVRDPNRRVGDILPSGNLWPDLPRRELDDLLDKEIVFVDFSFLNGRFGHFAVFLARFPGSDEQFTSACGGEIVCRKLTELKDGRHLPVLGVINYTGKYYDLT